MRTRPYTPGLTVLQLAIADNYPSWLFWPLLVLAIIIIEVKDIIWKCSRFLISVFGSRWDGF